MHDFICSSSPFLLLPLFSDWWLRILRVRWLALSPMANKWQIEAVTPVIPGFPRIPQPGLFFFFLADSFTITMLGSTDKMAITQTEAPYPIDTQKGDNQMFLPAPITCLHVPHICQSLLFGLERCPSIRYAITALLLLLIFMLRFLRVQRM